MSNEKKNDGGPAFPNVPTDTQNVGSWDMGMTLRDYFAAKAMQAMASAHDQHGVWTGGGDGKQNEITAREAYAMADAMLKAREE